MYNTLIHHDATTPPPSPTNFGMLNVKFLGRPSKLFLLHFFFSFFKACCTKGGGEEELDNY